MMVSAKKAREERQKEKALKAFKPGKERNWFAIWTTIAVIVVFAVIGVIVTVATINANNATKVDSSQVTPKGSTNDGYTITKKGYSLDAEPVSVGAPLNYKPFDKADGNQIKIFFDTACPHCRDFAENNDTQIEGWLKDGTIDSVSIHPMAFLTPYSAEGANAMSCVAENAPQDSLALFKAQNWLTLNQDSNPTGASLVRSLEDLTGASGDNFNKCIRGGQFDQFVNESTKRAQTGPVPGTTLSNTGITGTPSVFVNGYKYPGNPADATMFKEFVKHVLAGGTVEDWAGTQPGMGGDTSSTTPSGE